MKTKRMSASFLILALLILSVPTASFAGGLSAGKVYLNDGFGAYPTNAHEIAGYVISNKEFFQIAEISASNKAAFFEGGGNTSLTRLFDGNLSGFAVVSLVIKTYQKRPSFDVSLTNKTAKHTILSVTDGNIVLKDKKSAGSILANSLTSVDLVLDIPNGRVSIYLNGKRSISEWKMEGYKTMYDGISVSQKSADAAFAADNIAVYGGKKPDAAMTEKTFDPETKASLYVNQDPTDFTYFHSQHVLNVSRKYNFTSFDAKEGNSYVAERLDYKNPEKGDRLILTKNNDDSSYSDVFFQTSLETRTNYLPAGVRYKNFMLKGDIQITDPALGGQICMIRDNTSGSNVDFALNMQNGAVASHEGKALSGALKANTWHHIEAYFNFNDHLYDVYLDGAAVGLDLSIPETLNTPILMRCNLYKGQGSWIIRNWEFTGLSKPVKRQTDETGKVVPVVEHSSQFPDDSAIKDYLADKIVFHGEANVLYRNNEKIPLSAQSVYENNELYVPLTDFNRAYDVNLRYDADARSYTDGGKTYAVPTAPKEGGGAELAPVKALSGAIGWAAKHSGYGSMVIAARDGDELIDTSDRDFPWFDNQYTAEDMWSYPILSFSDAQEISNLIFFDRPTAAKLQEDFYDRMGDAPAHPRLLIGSDDVLRLRELRETDSYFRSMVEEFLKLADTYLVKPAPYYRFDNNDDMRTKGNAENNFDYNRKLALAYLLTGDRKYADKAISDLLCISEFPDINPAHIIDAGVWLRPISLVYDWCYDAMTDEQREKISDFILEKGIRVVQRTYYAMLPSGCGSGSGFQLSSWYPRWKSNYTAFVQGGLIPACLAVAEKDPDACFDTLEKTFRAWEYMLFGLYPGGVWLEGKSYQSILGQYIAYAAGSLKSVLGQTYQLLEYPGVQKSFSALMAYGSLTASFTFADDSEREPLGGISDDYQFYADYYDDDVLSMWRQLAFNNEYGKRFGGASATADVLDIVYYRPPMGEDILKDFSKVNVFEGGEIFTLHEDWLDKNAAFFVAAGGPTRHYHHHNDGGDFMFCKDGEMWTWEFGKGNYNIGSIYTRFSGRSEAHNTLTINPDEFMSQKLNSFAPIVKWEEGGGGAYAVYDMTELYEDDNAENVTRGFYIGDDYNTLTVRDEMRFSAQTTGWWFLHTDADVKQLNENEVLMSKNGKSMIVTIVCETDGFQSAVSTGKSRPLPESPVLEGDTTATTNINRIAVHFSGKGELNITVRMSDMAAPVNTTPIAQWKAPEKTEKVQTDSSNYNFDYDIFVDGHILDSKTVVPIVSPGSYPEFTIVPRGSGMKAEHAVIKALEDPMVVKISTADGSVYKYVTVKYSRYGELAMSMLYDILDVASYDVSAEPEPENHRGNMFDNDLSTRFSVYYDGATATFDLGAPKAVDAVGMGFWKGHERNYYFDIQTSNDGATFKTVGEYTSAGETEDYEVFSFPRETARYIRFVGHQNSVSDVNNILEFRVLQRKHEEG